jgi:hypothetical protein
MLGSPPRYMICCNLCKHCSSHKYARGRIALLDNGCFMDAAFKIRLYVDSFSDIIDQIAPEISKLVGDANQNRPLLRRRSFVSFFSIGVEPSTGKQKKLQAFIPNQFITYK